MGIEVAWSAPQDVKHEMRQVSEWMTDKVICSCGWDSGWYFDGMSFAISEWKRHVEEVSEV